MFDYLDCKIKDYRKKAGISQKILSNVTNISQNTISDYENNKIIPNLRHAYILALYFDVSVYDLFKIV